MRIDLFLRSLVDLIVPKYLEVRINDRGGSNTS